SRSGRKLHRCARYDEGEPPIDGIIAPKSGWHPIPAQIAIGAHKPHLRSNGKASFIDRTPESTVNARVSYESMEMPEYHPLTEASNGPDDPADFVTRIRRAASSSPAALQSEMLNRAPPGHGAVDARAAIAYACSGVSTSTIQ